MKKTNEMTIKLNLANVEFDKVCQHTLAEQSQCGLDALKECAENWIESIKLNINEIEQDNYLLVNTRMTRIVNSMRGQADYWEHLRKCFAVDAQEQTLRAIIDSNQK